MTGLQRVLHTTRHAITGERIYVKIVPDVNKIISISFSSYFNNFFKKLFSKYYLYQNNTIYRRMYATKKTRVPCINPFSAGTHFRRENMPFIDVRF